MSASSYHPYVDRLASLINTSSLSPDSVSEIKQFLQAIPLLEERRKQENIEFRTRFPLLSPPSTENFTPNNFLFTRYNLDGTKRKLSLLMEAADHGHHQLIADLLTVIDLDWANEQGHTALDFAVGCARELTSFYNRKHSDEDHVVVIQHLIDAKANIERPDKEGKTPLFHAIHIRSPIITQFLIENKANVNHRDKQGNTMLGYHLIESGSRIDSLNERCILQLLLDAKSDTELVFNSPVHSADNLTPFTCLTKLRPEYGYPMISLLTTHLKNYEPISLYQTLKERYKNQISLIKWNSPVHIVNELIENQIPYYLSTLNEIANRLREKSSSHPTLREIERTLQIMIPLQAHIQTTTRRMIFEALGYILPRVLTSIISEYDSPFQDSRISFFKPVISGHLKNFTDENLITRDMRSSFRNNFT